jgi:radical SAM superfamily enzyme YgiQ (UPF0313 family)
MKEIEVKNTDNIEVSIKQKKQQEYQLVNQIVPHDGHTIWKINKETLEIEKAKFKNAANFYYDPTATKEILVIEGYEYVSALNKKTALKKFNQGRNGGKEISQNPLTLAI